MNKQQEALKLALEALEVLGWQPTEEAMDYRDNAIDAIHKALASQPAQEPVATFKWLPEGATHLGRISVRVCAGGSLAMNTHAFKYDNGVLKVYVTDNDNEYPGWRDAKNVFFHLNFPVIPLYTSPPASKPWVGLTEQERNDLEDYCEMIIGKAAFEAIEAKLREKNERGLT